MYMDNQTRLAYQNLKRGKYRLASYFCPVRKDFRSLPLQQTFVRWFSYRLCGSPQVHLALERPQLPALSRPSLGDTAVLPLGVLLGLGLRVLSTLVLLHVRAILNRRCWSCIFVFKLSIIEFQLVAVATRCSHSSHFILTWEVKVK